MSSEDDQWLDALAGKPDPSASPRINREAAALRLALMAHRAATEPDEAVADEVLFQRIRAQLELTATSARKPSITPVQGAGEMRLAARSPMEAKWFALAASFLLAVGLGVNSWRSLTGVAPESDADAPRGKIFLIVADPKTRSKELVDGLGAIGAKAEVQTNVQGQIVISIARSDAVVAYLMDQQIPPSDPGSPIVLVLKQAKH
jgi:hypothetical protein